jgi:hypothetical protein
MRIARVPRGLGGAVVAALAAAAACRRNDAPPQPAPLFRTRTETGVDFVHDSGVSGKKLLIEINSGGVTLLDYDGDGDLDLFFPQGAPLPGYAGHGDFHDRLYRNDGAFRFTDVTAESGVSDAGATLDDFTYSAAAPDFDGDGDPDLYLCNVGRNRFLRNDGGRFVDATAPWGGDSKLWSTAAVFADFDRDQDLDLYVVNYVVEPLEHRPCGPLERGDAFRSYCHPDEFPPADDALYRNVDGRLVDVSAQAGLVGRDGTGSGGAGLGAALSDYDADGDLDIFVANDSTPNFLWRNDSAPRGELRFAEVARESYVAVEGSGLSTGAMGTDFGDVDGDGDFDLIVANLDMEQNTFYRNEGGGLFDDRSVASGLGPPSFLSVGFGCEFFDADLDGDLDCMVANGHVLDNIGVLEPAQTFRQRAHFYRNDGSGRFTQIGGEAGPYFEGMQVGRGLAIGDLDDDGDQDVVVAHWDGGPAILENATNVPGRAPRPWLGLRLVGRAKNVQAIGALVKVESGGRTQVEEVRGTSSYCAFHDLRLVFGLGGHAVAERVTVRWPDGTTTTHGPLAANRYHVLRQE